MPSIDTDEPILVTNVKTTNKRKFSNTLDGVNPKIKLGNFKSQATIMNTIKLIQRKYNDFHTRPFEVMLI